MTPLLTPPEPKLNHPNLLEAIISNAYKLQSSHPLVDIQELIEQLKLVLAKDVNPEIQIRGYLKIFSRTPTFQNAFEKLDPEMKKQLDAFISGKTVEDAIGGQGPWPMRRSPAAAEHAEGLDKGENKSGLQKVLEKGSKYKKHFRNNVCLRYGLDCIENRDIPGIMPIIFEDESRTKRIKIYANTPFHNWGLSVSNTPSLTAVPTKVLGVQNLVKYAKLTKKRIRCAGYRHSWSPIFSEDGEILVEMLDLKTATQVPDPSDLLPTPASNKTNELKSIDLVGYSAPEKALVRVGSAVTNEDFRRWQVSTKNWALAVNAILVEVTIGGIVAPIIHGAGRRHQTVCDLVRKIEYVDANGNLQVVSEPRLLAAAAGSFGLLGIITHVTLELDKMSYAILQPRKPPVALAIPPLETEDVPIALQEEGWQDKLDDALKDFTKRVTDDYYSEWFWFPYQKTAWVNTWNVTDDASEAKEDYPSVVEVWLQWVEEWIAGIMTSTAFFAILPGAWQAQLIATLGMAAQPPYFFQDQKPTTKTTVVDGIHFWRTDQNCRVRDMEINIPLQPLDSDPTKPDVELIRKAWWDVIKLVYDAGSNCPMRLTLEMRITGSSNIIMAPQYGNSLGTCSIEVLTIPNTVPGGVWRDFCQKVFNAWDSYGADGKKLNLRPHWSKEWVDLQIRGMPATKYMKEVAYKERIVEFKDRLQEIGKTQGWSLADLKARFSNKLWDEIVFS